MFTCNMTSIPPINDRRIRIALVGCGRISRNHIKAIVHHHELAELVALCDSEEERLDTAQELVVEAANANAASAQSPVKFIGYENLLAAVKSDALQVDLIVLTTPVVCILFKLLPQQKPVYMFVRRSQWLLVGKMESQW